MERYGSHSPSYYYDSYTPRAPVGDHPRSYSATRPPVRHMHHEDRRNDQAEQTNFSDTHFRETHSIQDHPHSTERVHHRPEFDLRWTHAEPEYSHLHFEDPKASHTDKHDYLVMHRPKQGSRKSVVSEQKKNPHLIGHDGHYVDEDMPVFKPLNVDPVMSKQPTPSKTESR